MFFVTKSYQCYKTFLATTMLSMAEKINSYHFSIMIFMGIFYKVTIDSLYVFAVSPQEAYMGLTTVFSYSRYLHGSILYAFLFLSLPKKEVSFSDFFLNLQFVITIAPMITYYTFNDQSTVYMYMICSVVLLQMYILNNSKSNGMVINFDGWSNYVSVFMMIFIPISLIITILWGGFSGLKAFDLYYLYEIRKYAEFPPLFGYILNWLTKAIIPFYIVFSLYKKLYWLTIMLILVDLVIYMTLGWKVIYLSLLVLLSVYFLAKMKILLKSIYLGLSLGSLFSIWFSLLEKQLLNTSSNFTHIFGTRFLFIPAQIKFQFYEFFSEYPFVFFADGLIGKMLGMTNIYSMSNGEVIYKYFYGYIGSNSNTGYLGESYSQLGFFGIVFMSILLAYIIKFVSVQCSKVDFSVVSALFALIMIVLNDGALFTSLLTGGMIFLIILLMIYGELLKDEDNVEMNCQIKINSSCKKN